MAHLRGNVLPSFRNLSGHEELVVNDGVGVFIDQRRAVSNLSILRADVGQSAGPWLADAQLGRPRGRFTNPVSPGGRSLS